MNSATAAFAGSVDELMKTVSGFAARVRDDCTPTNLSYVVLDMASDLTADQRAYLMGLAYVPFPVSTHRNPLWCAGCAVLDDDEDDAQADAGELVAACASVAAVLATAPVYLAALESRLPALLEVWISERLAVALNYDASKAHGWLARAARAALTKHAFGCLDLMAGVRLPCGLYPGNLNLLPVVPISVRTPARLRRELDTVASAIYLATDGMLEGVLGPRVVLAGGAVRDVMVDAKPNDLDLWVVGCANLAQCEAAATEAATRIIENGKQRGYMTRAVLTSSVLTLVLIKPYSPGHTVQIIKRRYVDVMQVVTSFDMDDAKCAFDGTRVYVTRSAMVALKSGVSVVNPWVATRSSRHVKQLITKGMVHVVPFDASFMAGFFASVRTAMSSTRTTSMSAALRAIADTSTLAGIVASDELRRMENRSTELSSSGESNRAADFPTVCNYAEGDTLDDVLPGRLRQDALAGGWQLTDPAARMYISDASGFLDHPPSC
jgi:hypothetical protein